MKNYYQKMNYNFYLFLIFSFFIKYTSLIILSGNFYYCPTYLPDKCFDVENIEIPSQIRTHCTQYIECLFLLNDKIQTGYLLDSYVITEYSRFIDCNIPTTKTLHNNNNRYFIQRQNNSLSFINLNKNNLNKIDNIIESLIYFFSLILNIITLALFVFFLLRKKNINFEPPKILSISKI